MAFLLDACPPDFRTYPLLRRHPVVLARFAGRFVEGQHHTAQQGVAEVRTSLAGRVPPEVVGAAVELWLEQAARLARTRRAVSLVEQALRGAVFVPRL